MAIQVTSVVFQQNQSIPQKYTCDGEDLSPPLAWTNLPKETKSLAILCLDPDAPMGNFTHWVVFNIDYHVLGLPEGVITGNEVRGSLTQGKNGFGKIGYGGPCPPKGKPHRYVFTVFALDTHLELQSGATKAELLEAMQSHILDTGELVGMYSR